MVRKLAATCVSSLIQIMRVICGIESSLGAHLVLPRRGYTHRGIYVVRRARLRLGENRYHLLTNNCEHCCEWFIRGEHRSHQVDELSARCVRVRQKLRSTLVLFPALLGWRAQYRSKSWGGSGETPLSRRAPDTAALGSGSRTDRTRGRELWPSDRKGLQ